MDVLFFLLSLACFLLLIVGLVKPKSLSKFFKKEPNRKKILLTFGSFTVLFLIICGGVADTPQLSNQDIGNIENQQEPIINNSEKTIEDNQNNEQLVEEQPNEPVITEVQPEPEPTPIPEPEPELTPAPTPTPEPEPTSSETVSQKNAVAKAKTYLGYSAFSYGGLVDQLEYEQFSHADAVYGADNCGANWNEQAVKKAQSYMEYSAFSRGGLIEQLLYEKFTQAQAEYGANAVGL